MEKIERETYLAHFPKNVSREIVEYVTEVVLVKSRYIFIEPLNKVRLQYGYCTHCKNRFRTNEKLKHNSKTMCIKCGSECTVKSSGLGRKTLNDDGYFVWYEKSAVNPKAIIAQGIYVHRDYSKDYTKVTTQFSVINMYIFEPGQSTMITKWGTDFKKRKKVSSNSGIYTPNNHLAIDSVKEAVKDTQFQYSTWENYFTNSDYLVEFFDLAAKYPCIEYLSKLGFRKLVIQKMYGGYQTFGAINWRGKSVQKVLKMEKAEIKELINSKVEVDFRLLHAYRSINRYNKHFSFNVAHELKYLTEDMRAINRMAEFAPIEKVIGYIMNQSQKAHIYTRLIMDYMDDCMELGMDFSKSSVLFPNDLVKAHQDTNRKIKSKLDETKNKNIQARAKKLEAYSFEHKGLIIRPARTSKELYEEGKKLKHCVARNYSKSYANGETNIFFIRNVMKPNEPFFTVEISLQNKIVQVHGLDYLEPTDKVKEFLEIYKIQVLLKNKSRQKIRTISA